MGTMESFKRSLPTITIIFLLGIITADIVKEHSIHIDTDVDFYCQNQQGENQGRVLKLSNKAHHFIWVNCH